jgi:hypothetical protein
VEGRDDNEDLEAQMDLDDGGNDVANGSDKGTESSDKNGSQSKEKKDQPDCSCQKPASQVMGKIF